MVLPLGKQGGITQQEEFVRHILWGSSRYPLDNGIVERNINMIPDPPKADIVPTMMHHIADDLP